MESKLHIGNMIRRQLFEKNITVAELSRRINRSREATREMLDKQSLNTELLLQICDALDYDFFSVISKARI